MSRRKIMFVRELIDLLGRQLPKNCEIAQERVAQSVDPLEVLKKQDQPLEVRRFQLAIDAVKGVGDRVDNLLALKVTLELENIVLKLQSRDIAPR